MLKRVIVFLFSFLFIYPQFNITYAADMDIFISEYIEGTSFNKALEIFNPNTEAISLDQYRLESHVNGSVTKTYTYSFASGTVVNSQATWVICNSNFDSNNINLCDATASGVLNFNGNDAITLVDLEGKVLDIFGQIGLDPSTGWGVGETITLDNTLRRKCQIVTGVKVNTSFDPEGEWDGAGVDVFDNLGVHTLCLQTSSPTPAPTTTPSPSPTASPTSTPVSSLTPTPQPSSTPIVTPKPKKATLLIKHHMKELNKTFTIIKEFRKSLLNFFKII